MSSNGRPGTRQGVRTPHRGAELPVDAYSLAVSCGDRGVSCDIWPASLSAPSAPRVVLFQDTTGSLPVPHDTSRHDLVPATPSSLPGRRGVPPAPWRPSWPSWYTSVRALPRIWCTGALRCVVDRLPLLRCSEALGQHSRCCHHTLGSSSRPRRLWRPVSAAHHTTASSRGHQRSC